MKNNISWIYKVFLLAFILSIIFSSISSTIAHAFNSIVLIIIGLIVISIGLLFDMIGVAVLTSKESSLHAKASKKAKGAKQAINLVKNSTQVASICNDVVGDVCGIVSGTLGAVLAINISTKYNINITIITVLITAIISSLTIGFKAVFKNIAMKNSDDIVFTVGKVISIFKK